MDQIYDEYYELHKYQETVADAFQRHQSELHMIKDETSKEYEEKRNRIIKEYVERQNDPEYVKKRERYAKIYTRLNFIHDLCKQFDSTL